MPGARSSPARMASRAPPRRRSARRRSAHRQRRRRQRRRTRRSRSPPRPPPGCGSPCHHRRSGRSRAPRAASPRTRRARRGWPYSPPMKPPWWLGNTTASVPSRSATAGAAAIGHLAGPTPRRPRGRSASMPRAARRSPARSAVTVSMFWPSSGSFRVPSSSAGIPNIAGSGAGWPATSAVNGPAVARRLR